MVKDLPALVEKRWESTLRCNDKKELSQGKEWYEDEFGSHFSVGKKLQEFSWWIWRYTYKKSKIVWGIFEMKCSQISLYVCLYSAYALLYRTYY